MIGTKMSMIYINDMYHDSIVIFSSENIMIFSIFSKYQPTRNLAIANSSRVSSEHKVNNSNF